ncbi:GDP-L-fucose synthase, partial [Alphaproteobacteria bacterium]|nr:GDP-L-fucose synthase [Alphaproteobacteria bacterium]
MVDSKTQKNIFVAGHKGMVGSALVRQLMQDTKNKLLLVDRSVLDLKNQNKVRIFFEKNEIDCVYIAAAKVGGILANKDEPFTFLIDNLLIQNNLISAAKETGVKQLLFLGSSCIYPKFSNQPICEEELLSGYLENTNEAYAIAKIAGLKLCSSINTQFDFYDYRSLMPCNLYGPGDNYNLSNSHVIPAVIRKIYEAKTNNHKSVTFWGSGSPMREFMHVDDLAKGCIYFMNYPKDKIRDIYEHHFNIGYGEDISIKELINLVKEVIQYEGQIEFDIKFPDGTPKKLLDNSKILSLGWKPEISLREGISKTYKDFLENLKKGTL